jgi:hypothetical protein
MPGQGKYTTYYNNVQESEKKQLLEKAFSSSPFAQNSYNQADVVKTANKYLACIGDSESGVPFLQKGDPGLFPEGVMLDYSGTPNGFDADISKVEWKKAGDPANPYVPDIRSPGIADGVDLSNNDTSVIVTNVDASNGDPRQSNPEITTDQIKVTYTPASQQGDIFENKGTVNPEYTGPKIHAVAAVSVDNPLRLGSSMKSAGET